MTGIPQLQALGKQLSTGAMAQASDYADRGQQAGEQRALSNERGLQRAMTERIAQQASRDRWDIANLASADRRAASLHSGQPDTSGAPPAIKMNASQLREHRSRVGQVQAALAALERVRLASDAVGDGGGFVEGRVPAWGVEAQEFENAGRQLLSTGQLALRVAGLGSQSDKDLKVLEESYPQRSQEQTVRNAAIKGLYDRFRIINEKEELGLTMDAPGAPAGASNDRGRTERDSKRAELLKLYQQGGPDE